MEKTGNIIHAIANSLNNSETGAAVMEQIKQEAIRRDMTPEQWEQFKIDFLKFSLLKVMEASAEIKNIISGEVYEEINKQS